MESKSETKISKTQDADILELEHVIGSNSKYSHAVRFISNTKGYFVYLIGGLVVIEDINDKHNQRFLRGHDMDVSCISIGSSGNKTKSASFN